MTRNSFGKTVAAILLLILASVDELRICAQENPEAAHRAMPVAAGPNDVARFLAGIGMAGTCRIF